MNPRPFGPSIPITKPIKNIFDRNLVDSLGDGWWQWHFFFSSFFTRSFRRDRSETKPLPGPQISFPVDNNTIANTRFPTDRPTPCLSGVRRDRHGVRSGYSTVNPRIPTDRGSIRRRQFPVLPVVVDPASRDLRHTKSEKKKKSSILYETRRRFHTLR